MYMSAVDSYIDNTEGPCRGDLLHTLIPHHRDFNCLGVRKILSLNRREWGLKSLFKVSTCSRTLELRSQNRGRMQKNGVLQRGRKEPGFVPQRGCSLRVAALEEQGGSPLPLPWWSGGTSCPGIFTLRGSVCNCRRGGSLCETSVKWVMSEFPSNSSRLDRTPRPSGKIGSYRPNAGLDAPEQCVQLSVRRLICEPGLGCISHVVYLAKKRV